MFQLNPFILSRGSLQLQKIAKSCTNRTNCRNCISNSRWKEFLRPLPAEQLWVRFKSWYVVKLEEIIRYLVYPLPARKKESPGFCFLLWDIPPKSVLSFSWHFKGEGRVRGLKVKIKVVPQTEEFGGTMEDQQQHSSQITNKLWFVNNDEKT